MSGRSNGGSRLTGLCSMPSLTCRLGWGCSHGKGKGPGAHAEPDEASCYCVTGLPQAGCSETRPLTLFASVQLVIGAGLRWRLHLFAAAERWRGDRFCCVAGPRLEPSALFRMVFPQPRGSQVLVGEQVSGRERKSTQGAGDRT